MASQPTEYRRPFTGAIRNTPSTFVDLSLATWTTNSATRLNFILPDRCHSLVRVHFRRTEEAYIGRQWIHHDQDASAGLLFGAQRLRIGFGTSHTPADHCNPSEPCGTGKRFYGTNGSSWREGNGVERSVHATRRYTRWPAYIEDWRRVTGSIFVWHESLAAQRSFVNRKPWNRDPFRFYCRRRLPLQYGRIWRYSLTASCPYKPR